METQLLSDTAQIAMPAHLIDWTVLANDQLSIPVNSLQLSLNSRYFHQQFSQLSQPERVTRVSYEQPESLLLMLQLIGCTVWPGGVSEAATASASTTAVVQRQQLGGDDREQLELALLDASNIAGLVLAALHFQAPKMLDLALFVVQRRLNRDNCWQFWRAAVRTNWSLLKALVQSKIAADFLPASALPGFLELTESELASFLHHRHLNVDSELELLGPIVHWLGHQSEQRQQPPQPGCIASLLRAVRQNRLTPAEAREFDRCQLLAACGVSRAADLLAPPPSPAGETVAEEEATAAAAAPSDSETPARVPHQAIFVCGGWEGLQNDPNFGPSEAVQIYNYHERAWIRHSQPPGPVLGCGHAYSGCVLLGHCVYVVGGYVQNRGTGYQGPTASVKAYDLRRRRWRPRAPMHHQRNYVSAAALDGYVYAVGGHNGRGRLNTAERYWPEENRWLNIASLLQVRSDAGCAGLQGHLYVCGGFNGHQFFSSVERYDPLTDQWSYVAAMQSVRSGVSVCQCDGQLYALGGNNGNSRLATVERYDPELNQWSQMPQMLTQRSNFSAALLRGEIYAIGGWSDQTNSTVSIVEKWRPGPTNAWELVPSLRLPASANCCCDVAGLELVEDLLTPTGPQPQQQQQQQQQQPQQPQPQQQTPQQEHQNQTVEETAELESSSD